MVNFENLKLILMRKTVLLLFCSLSFITNFAQTVPQKLQAAFKQFENDPQLKYAISSLYVIDAATGKVVFDKNSSVGLAPASTQKIITAATAFSVLGKDYRYKTELGYTGKIEKNILKGDIFITGNGDPTFGSSRFDKTKDQYIFSVFKNAIESKGIQKLEGNVFVDERKWTSHSIPDGWIWQDIGNYYGAGATALNWRENQYDIFLQSGKTIGNNVEVVKTEPKLYTTNLISELKAAAKGSGDNAYIYLPPYSNTGYIRGTIPIDEKNFSISGSLPNPPTQFVDEFAYYLNTTLHFQPLLAGSFYSDLIEKKDIDFSTQPLYTHYSPTLDSIIYWFLQKSINLYGEAMVKTLAYQTKGNGNTNDGIQIIKDFWKAKGIDANELNIGDGSGLSPQNRVTTHAQVEVLKYAKTQSWYDAYYKAFPEYNGMKMKSGTIKDVKGFCGYHKAADGKEYIFSFLVNNYNGSSSALTNKMFKVLNVLK